MLKEEFKSGTIRDFNARYGETFGWYEKESGDRLLVKLLSTDSATLTFTDHLGIRYTAEADMGNVFCFIPVERKMFNMGDDVWCTSRKNARQWKRGMCSSNTEIYSFLRRDWMAISFENVLRLYQDKPGLQQVANFKQGKWDNVALSDTFAIVGNKVFVYHSDIGTYKDGKIKLTNDLFVQEVKDAVRRGGFAVEVVIESAKN